jgi:hypothetical protein
VQFDVLKYTLKKLENTLYELSLTGAGGTQSFCPLWSTVVNHHKWNCCFFLYQPFTLLVFIPELLVFIPEWLVFIKKFLVFVTQRVWA